MDAYPDTGPGNRLGENRSSLVALRLPKFVNAAPLLATNGAETAGRRHVRAGQAFACNPERP
jgi:hypothetical protein